MLAPCSANLTMISSCSTLVPFVCLGLWLLEWSPSLGAVSCAGLSEEVVAGSCCPTDGCTALSFWLEA